MDFGKLVGDAFAYAKDGLTGNMGTYLMLLVLSVLPAIPVVLGIVGAIFLFMNGMPDLTVLAGLLLVIIVAVILLASFNMGYMLRILRGTTPLPPVSDFPVLFADGIRYIVIQIIYMIPAALVFCVTVVPALLTMLPAMTSSPDSISPMAFLGMGLGILATIIVAFICGLFATIGQVRFARTGSVGEAFNFGAITDTIGKIGWLMYILALIIMAVIVTVISVVLGIIPFIGGILQFLIGPFITVFTMRYICMVYDSAETP